MKTNHTNRKQRLIKILYRSILAFLPGPVPRKSLAQLYPKLANEWNYIKNKPLNPTMFTPGSHFKVWWNCSRGHEWESIIANRTKGTGCPYCAGRRAGKDNNLVFKNPNLAKQWHPTKNKDLTPDQVTPGSEKKVWWKCT